MWATMTTRVASYEADQTESEVGAVGAERLDPYGLSFVPVWDYPSVFPSPPQPWMINHTCPISGGILQDPVLPRQPQRAAEMEPTPVIAYDRASLQTLVRWGIFEDPVCQRQLVCSTGWLDVSDDLAMAERLACSVPPKNLRQLDALIRAYNREAVSRALRRPNDARNAACLHRWLSPWRALATQARQAHAASLLVSACLGQSHPHLRDQDFVRDVPSNVRAILQLIRSVSAEEREGASLALSHQLGLTPPSSRSSLAEESLTSSPGGSERSSSDSRGLPIGFDWEPQLMRRLLQFYGDVASNNQRGANLGLHALRLEDAFLMTSGMFFLGLIRGRCQIIRYNNAHAVRVPRVATANTSKAWLRKR